jgi:hypothetical protein
MKTAVEILEQQLYEWLDGRIYLPPNFFEQAKEMEKEQIMNAYKRGYKRDSFTPNFREQEELFEQYYNETFKSE